MRIIGGIYKSHRFYPPKKIPARPTTDIAKEGLFNVLFNYFDFEDLSVLDLFGGTGSISYEFASRHCADITLVERDRRSVQFIKETVKKYEMPIKVLQMDVFKFIQSSQQQFKLIFAGPPYPLKTLSTIPDQIFQHQLLQEGGWLILEHNPNHNFDDHPKFHFKRNYGTTIFSIFEENVETQNLASPPIND